MKIRLNTKHLMRTTTALAIGVLITAPLQGAVISTDIEDIPFFSVGDFLSQTIDIDFNGSTDVLFRNFGDELAAFSTSSSRIAGISAVPPNQNSFAAAFIVGASIGPSFVSLYNWNTGYSGLVSCRDIGCLGLWGSKEAYLGVEFQIVNNTHYGWVLVDTPFDFGGGYIKSFAYETEPGKAIIAGAVPEPSYSILFVMGILTLLVKRRRP